MPREPIFSTGVRVLTADYKDATFEVAGLIDKLDVSISNGDALVQFKTPARGEWVPESGIYLKNGLAISMPGVSEIHANDGGVDAFRLKRAVAATDSSIEAKAWLR